MAKEERTTSSTGGQKGVKLARYSLIPPVPLELLAEHYGKGAKKYDVHQWRKGYEYSKSYDALLRHLQAWWRGEDLDICSNDELENCSHEFEGRRWDGPEDTCWNHTGSHHIQAVMWHSFCLMEFIATETGEDDRYVRDDVGTL